MPSPYGFSAYLLWGCAFFGRNLKSVKKTNFINALLAAGLLLLLGLGYWFGPQLGSLGSKGAGGTTTLPVSPCDLNQGACTVALPGGGRLVASIGPRPIPVLKPLHIEVNVQGRSVSGVRLDFSGVDMDMGFNQTELKPGESSRAGELRFTGRGNLPVCVTGKMRWQVIFILDEGGASLAVPFHFDA